ncbi:hypothetical protein EYF80_016212 [Liparis tanakae]|uniref:Uncharacterized protein n=1 Tax=Liparis tanakae TaxID=230148 RepID=A0A4Z2I6E5_9TELE|nr:hypothetical protein EYF80_016212 [Liparis tanakae]
MNNRTLPRLCCRLNRRTDEQTEGSRVDRMWSESGSRVKEKIKDAWFRGQRRPLGIRRNENLLLGVKGIRPTCSRQQKSRVD